MANLNEMTISEFTGVFNYLLDNNKALQGWNNPDPTTAVKGPSAVGEYAPGNN